MATLGQRVRQAREAAGIRSQSELARRIKTTPQTIQAIEADEVKGSRLVVAIADACGVSATWLQYERGSMHPEQPALPGVPAPVSPNVVPAPPRLDRAFLGDDQAVRDVPVLGTAVGGSDGDFVFNGQIIDYARRPSGLAGRKGVFVLFVIGTSMADRYEPGDPVFLDEARPARPGDYVVVECHGKDDEPGPAYLKRLIAITGSKVRLKQLNPPDDKIEIPLKRVKRIYRVIPLNELVGV